MFPLAFFSAAGKGFVVPVWCVAGVMSQMVSKLSVSRARACGRCDRLYLSEPNVVQGLEADLLKFAEITNLSSRLTWLLL